MNSEYLLRKIFHSAITLFIVLIINYFLFRIMPGDPVSMIMRNPNANPSMLAQVKSLYGFDKPQLVQFAVYLRELVKGNFGMSFFYRQPVIDVIGSRLFATLVLAFAAEIVAIFLGILLGKIAAVRRGEPVDAAILGFSLVTYAMPTFWLGIVFIAFFCVHLGLFPTVGMYPSGVTFAGFADKAVDLAKHLFLPAVTLAVVIVGGYSMIMRSSLLDVLSEDYITTARAKGLSRRDVINRHAVPNARLPIITIIAINLGFMIAGALQVETVFSWPGIGRLMYEALKARDYPLLQGIFLIVSFCVILANFAADIMYGYLDPRIRY
jgi:peptide/nickel transport system permease protein